MHSTVDMEPELPRLPPAIPRFGMSPEASHALGKMLSDSQQQLRAAFIAGDDPARLIAWRSDLVSMVVRHIWVRLLGTEPGLVLYAVGGFGRGRLFPYSDVDLLVIVASAEVRDACEASLSQFFTCLWDIGLDVGQAVRSLDECDDLAAQDVGIYTSLLDRRYLCGDEALLPQLDARLEGERLWSHKHYLAAKRDEQAARYARFEDTAHHLEPNLKDGLGGLRALDTLRWLSKHILGANTWPDLVERQMIDQAESSQLAAAEATLIRYRFALHLLAGRPEERLLFDYQQELAAFLGFADTGPGNLGVEQFMQGYYRAVAAIDRIGTQAGERLDEWLDESTQEDAIDAFFSVVGSRLTMRDDERFIQHPAALIDVFLTRLDYPEPLTFSAQTMRNLHEAVAYHGTNLAHDPAVLARFLALLRRGPEAAHVLWQMHRYGLLAAIIPPFGKVVGRMQYDLFHAYTVDEHTLRVVRNVAQYADTDMQRELPLGCELYASLSHPELLTLAAIFHDIAKGRGGDHSILGETDARTFCTRLGLDDDAVDLVAWLVRWHLYMSDTAQRKDITDPHVIRAFAAKVGDWERLDYLYLLTVADIRGTSPKLWNSWKDRLLSDLYVAGRYALRADSNLPLRTEARVVATRKQALQLLAQDGFGADAIADLWADFPDATFLRHHAEQIAWQTRAILRAEAQVPLVEVHPFSVRGATELFVYANDQKGIFAAITAILDRQRFSIVEARILSSQEGKAMDTFLLLEARTQKPASLERVEVLRQHLLTGLREVGAVTPAQRGVSRQLKHFQMEPRIEFSLDQSKQLTQMALVCTDKSGILANAAQAFLHCDIQVHDARIATFGERVEDFFLLSNAHGLPLDDAACRTLTQTLKDYLK